MSAYREKLYPAWWLILAIFLAVPTSILLFFPLSILVGTLTGLVLWLSTVGLLWWASPVVRVDSEYFHAGRSRIAHQHIASMEAVGKEDARAEKSVNLDARAWLVLRPWIDPAVKVTLRDPDDPTPYWLVSSRNPQALVDAWKQASN